jgi:hypothetical protein
VKTRRRRRIEPMSRMVRGQHCSSLGRRGAELRRRTRAKVSEHGSTLVLFRR